MAWKGTELIIRIAADLKKYRDGLREVASETKSQMAAASSATNGLTTAHRTLEGQAARTTTQLVRAGQAAASGDFARAGQDVAALAGHMGRGGAAASVLGIGLGAAAVALGSYLVISYKASAEYERQANLLALTGNAAGLVAGEMNKMARSVAESGNTTVGAARSITEELVSTGKIGRTALESMGTSIALVSRASGESQESVTADFKKMADGVTKWAVTHNERYHFLTVDQYRYIKSLEDAGRTQEAMRATTDALNKQLEGIGSNVGYLQGAWRSLAKAISSAVDAMLNWGRVTTTGDKLASAAAGIAETREKMEYHQKMGYSGQVEKDKALLAVKLQAQSVLQSDARLERQAADAKAASVRATAAQIAKEEESSNSKQRSAGSSKKLSDAEREAAKAAKELAQARVAAQELTDRAGQAYAKAADAMAESNQALREEIAMIGASASERAKLIRAKEEDIIASKELELMSLRTADADAVTIANLEREIALRRQRLELLDRKADRENAVEVERETTAALRQFSQQSETAWDRSGQYLADALADGIAAGFADGESFADGFGNYLKKTFKQAVAQELSAAIKGGLQAAFTGNNSGMMNSWTGAAMQYFTGGSSGASAASMMYANGVGAAGGDSLGALYSANGGWAGVSTGGTGAAAANGGTAAAGGTSVMAYAGYAALIYAAVKYAESLYAKGYNRDMLGSGQAQRYRYGQGNVTSGYTSDSGYKYTEKNVQRQIADGLGMNKKWADILSGTTRYAHMFGKKMNGYGYQVGINGGNVDVGGYESYRAGWARRLIGRAVGRGDGSKKINTSVSESDASMVRAQVNSVREGAKAMATAMGMSSEAVDKYTGRLKINMKGANTAAEQSERMTKAMTDLQYSLMKAASGGKMARGEFDRLMAGVAEQIQAAGISASGMADIIAQGMMGRMSQAQVGEALSEMVIGGIYNMIVSPFAAQIANAFMSQIIQPMVVAVTTGGSISSAVSQAAMDGVIASANRAIDYLTQILENPEFRAGMNRLMEGLNRLAGASVKPAAHVRAYGSAVSSSGAAAKQAADQIKSAWQSLTDSIIDEVRRLRGEILGTSEQGQAYAMARYTTATAQARAGDQAAAERLPELSRAVEEAAVESARTRSDLNAVRGYLIESQMRTASILAGRYGLTIPAFADGGMHAGGVRLVGERGPELEVTGPARYLNNQQTQQLLGGGDGSTEVAAEVRLLRGQVDRLQLILGRVATADEKSAQVLDDLVKRRYTIKTEAVA